MRIIVIGANGMLGRYMSSYFKKYECISLMRNDLNALNNNDNITAFLDSIIRRNDIVINCVGILKPHIKKIGKTNTILINSVFPEIVSQSCIKNGAKMIHISSDCVFDGLRGGYTEYDTAFARDIYAQTKLIEPAGALTIRTSFIGENNRDTNVGLLGWLLKNKNQTIKGYINCLWNGVTCLQLAKTIDSLIINNKVTSQLKHIYSPEVINKYELCCIVNDIYNLNLKIIKHEAIMIEGTVIDGTLDRSLQSVVEPNVKLPDIRTQIDEQKKYKL